MSKFQITFVFNAENETVTDLEVTRLTAKEASKKKLPSNLNAKIELKGSSLSLTDEILDVLKAKVDSKLVLTVDGGKAYITNPKLNPKVKGGNKVTAKLTTACRGKSKDDLEAIGTVFGFKTVTYGVIELIPVGDSEDVLQITEEVDEVISDEDIETLLGDDVEEIDPIDLDN